MDGKKLVRIMPVIVAIGFCVVEGLKAILLLGASRAPDPASGHTEAALFAPEISTSWSYITPAQILILTVVTGTVLLLAVSMLVLQWQSKWLAMREDAPEPSRPPVVPRNVSSFGRRASRRA